MQQVFANERKALEEVTTAGELGKWPENKMVEAINNARLKNA